MHILIEGSSRIIFVIKFTTCTSYLYIYVFGNKAEPHYTHSELLLRRVLTYGISLLKPLFAHLLASSLDDSNKWSNLGFGEEIGILELKMHILLGVLQTMHVFTHYRRPRRKSRRSWSLRVTWQLPPPRLPSQRPTVCL